VKGIEQEIRSHSNELPVVGASSALPIPLGTVIVNPYNTVTYSTTPPTSPYIREANVSVSWPWE